MRANSGYRILELLGERCEVFHVRFGTESFRRHYHDTYSLGLIEDGANVFTYRRRVVEVPAGRICIAEPGEVHDGGLGGRPWSYRSMLFPATLFRALQDEDYIGGDLSFPPGIIVDNELSSLLGLLFAELISPGADRAAVEERAVTFFSKLLDLRCTRVRRNTGYGRGAHRDRVYRGPRRRGLFLVRSCSHYGNEQIRGDPRRFGVHRRDTDAISDPAAPHESKSAP